MYQLLQKEKNEMKTRYKILIVITIFVIFFFIRMPLAEACFAITDNDIEACKPFMILFSETAPVMRSNHVWDTGDGIGAWSGTVDGIEIAPFPFMPEDNVNAILIYFVMPVIIILGIYYLDKRK